MEDFNKKLKKVIYFFITVFIIALIAIIICLLMLKYEVEGEGNMPFELSQMVSISTAEGIEKTGEKIWNLDLIQNNDIYLHISKNKNYKGEEIIKNIKLNNFEITKQPAKGEIIIYRPSNSQDKVFEYKDEYIVNDNLVFQGTDRTNLKQLEVANQGAVITFRCSNKNLRRIQFRRTNNK